MTRIDIPPAVAPTRGDRFFAKVDADGDCWLWTGSHTGDGYGHFSLGGDERRMVYAHRWLYEHLVGPIPDGLELDHLCRNRPCVNPDHLEPVTHTENIRRGMFRERSASARRAKSHCKHGHKFTPENTVILDNDRRGCRECRRYRSRQWKARRAGTGGTQ